MYEELDVQETDNTHVIDFDITIAELRRQQTSPLPESLATMDCLKNSSH